MALLMGRIPLAVVWQALPETLRQRAPEPISFGGIARTYGGLMRSRAFLAHLAILATSFAGLFAWISGSAFVLQDLYRLSAFGYSVAFAICSLGYLLGTFAATQLVGRIGLGPSIGIGSGALAAGGLAMCGTLALGLTSIIAIVAPTTLYLFGLGLAMPQAMAGALTPFPDRAGAASSLLGFVQQSSAALLGAVVGHMLGASAWPIAIPLAIMGTSALLVWVVSRDVRAQAARKA
jgi:DHA1 family bicyclomycin/chloramphenicol resistance-like MFS transporter